MKIVGKAARKGRLSVQEFHRLRSELDEPFIIEGALDDWPAFRLWDPPYLKELLGDGTVRYKYSPHGVHPNFFASELGEMFATKEGSFSEYLDLITVGPKEQRTHYFFTGDEQFLYRVRDGKSELNELLAPLWKDVREPEYLPEGKLYSVWSWFSAQGMRSWLHYDNNDCHNLNAQIRGSKKCWLLSPKEEKKIALFPKDGPNPAHNCSQIDIFHPDPTKFPQFEEAEAIEAEILEGDLFYLPANWSHAFEHQGALNVNVNFWFQP